MQVVMVMFRADGERRSFSLTRDLTVIGRREDCDLRIPLGDVSRKHCRIVRNGDSVVLEDLGSSNGTFVNGQQIQECSLTPGDTIQIGPVVFCVQIDGVPAEEDMAPIFAAPAEPAYDEAAEPVEEVGEYAAEEGVEALEEVAADADADAALEDFEPVEADDEQPVARPPVPPGAEEPVMDAEEEAVELTEEDVVAEEEHVDIFVEDDAAEGDQITADPSAETTEDELTIDDFEIVDDATPGDEESESGETPSNSNRH